MSTSHPPLLKLEMWHSGERTADLARHLDGCSACQLVLRQLEEQRRAFLSQVDPERFVRELRLRLDAEAPRPRAFRGLALGAGALAAIGSMFVALTVPSSRLPLDPSHGEPVALQPSQRAPERIEELPADLVPKGSGGVGAGSLGLIVKRGDEQTLVRGNVTIVPGDELRLRFNLSDKATLGAAILTDAGAWVPFFDGEFEAGLHTPEATLRVDAEPSSGQLFFGSLEQLASARSQRAPVSGVQVITLHWQARP